MRLKFLTILLAAASLTACSTTEMESASAYGTGGAYASPSETPMASMGQRAPETWEEIVAQASDRVLFGYDQYNLTPDARKNLGLQAEWLLKHADLKIVIEGHADERGTREYNLALGDRRANAARDYLITLGISQSRISTISYGKERPAVTGSNETAWAQNRRAVTVTK